LRRRRLAWRLLAQRLGEPALGGVTFLRGTALTAVGQHCGGLGNHGRIVERRDELSLNRGADYAGLSRAAG
jgi:hypothetical protein